MDNRVSWADLCLSKFICWYPKPSTSECHMFVEKGFKEVIQIKWGHKHESVFNLTGNLTRRESWTPREISDTCTHEERPYENTIKSWCLQIKKKAIWCLALVFQPSELWENEFPCKSVVFCYGSPSKLMHRKKNIKHKHLMNS